jgi:hypothetical protein
MTFWNIDLGLSSFDNRFLCHVLPLIELICLVVCVGPIDSNVEETLNTLIYAN